MHPQSVVTVEHTTFLGFISEILCTIINIYYALVDYIMIVNAASSKVEQQYQE